MTLFFRYLPSPNWSLVLAAAAILCLSTTGIAEGAWGDEIADPLTFYKSSYPNSNWDTIKVAALGLGGDCRGDQQSVRLEMGK